MTNIKIGEQLPQFTSTTTEGAAFTLDDLKGSPTVLYFYPKDNTSGCTLEAKSLRDGKEELKRRGFKIVGVSPDSVKSHQNFCQKHDLNFTLLSDADHSLSEALGVWRLKKMYGREYMGIVRTTFLLDAEARVTDIIEKVDTKDAYGQIVKILDNK
jgi:peroxiredoxin Q/BCP